MSGKSISPSESESELELEQLFSDLDQAEELLYEGIDAAEKDLHSILGEMVSYQANLFSVHKSRKKILQIRKIWDLDDTPRNRDRDGRISQAITIMETNQEYLRELYQSRRRLLLKISE